MFFRLVPLLLLLVAAAAAAQDEPVEIPPPRPGDLEARAFYAVYDFRNPAFEGLMRSVNGAATPVFILAVPASGVGALAAGESGGATGRLALSELSALGLVALGKFTVRRARPFVTLPDVTPRQRRPPGGLDPYSFPSGHSAMAFALATSTSLSYPEWYVAVPAYLWASATATARIWFGMHYPSDTVIGAAVGTGAALLVHALLAGGEEDGPAEAQVALVTFRIGL